MPIYPKQHFLELPLQHPCFDQAEALLFLPNWKFNLISQPENTKKYHVQPRLFLSLKDTFDYIMRHDNALMKRIEGTSQEVQLQMG